MIDAERLLAHARSLAGTGRGRPPEADLRRGVSACYYVLYHAMTKAIVDQVAPDLSDTDKSRLRRTWGHGEISGIAELIASRATVLQHNPAAPLGKSEERWGPLVDISATDATTVEFCRAVSELRKQREDADYSHLAPFDKARLLGAYQDARRGLDALNGASRAGQQALVTLLIGIRADFRDR